MTLYNILHGPEAWLALAIWGAGAMFGIAVSWAAIEISDRREETRSEHDKSDMDHPGERGGGPPAGGPSDRRGG